MADAMAGKGTVTGPVIRSWLQKSADVLTRNRAYLTELDGPIGDSDHGNNMDRGYKAILEKLSKRDGTAETEPEDVGALLKTVAMTLISKVGGAAGPLYGTFFLDGSKPLKDKTEISAEDLAQFLDDGVAGVRKRGHSDVGMKTMLDALVPAAQTFRAAIGQGSDMAAALAQAAEAAKGGMEATIPMLAQRGRASYLGERSIGHQDPGATSSYLILQALADAVPDVDGEGAA